MRQSRVGVGYGHSSSMSAVVSTRTRQATRQVSTCSVSAANRPTAVFKPPAATPADSAPTRLVNTRIAAAASDSQQPSQVKLQQATAHRAATQQHEKASAGTGARSYGSLPEPPLAPRRPHIRQVHGSTRHDDWHWLRDPARTDPEVQAYLASEQAYSKTIAQQLWGHVQKRLQREIEQRSYKHELRVSRAQVLPGLVHLNEPAHDMMQQRRTERVGTPPSGSMFGKYTYIQQPCLGSTGLCQHFRASGSSDSTNRNSSSNSSQASSSINSSRVSSTERQSSDAESSDRHGVAKEGMLQAQLLLDEQSRSQGWEGCHIAMLVPSPTFSHFAFTEVSRSWVPSSGVKRATYTLHVCSADDGQDIIQPIKGVNGPMAWSPTGDRLYFICNRGRTMKAVQVPISATQGPQQKPNRVQPEHVLTDPQHHVLTLKQLHLPSTLHHTSTQPRPAPTHTASPACGAVIPIATSATSPTGSTAHSVDGAPSPSVLLLCESVDSQLQGRSLWALMPTVSRPGMHSPSTSSPGGHPVDLNSAADSYSHQIPGSSSEVLADASNSTPGASARNTAYQWVPVAPSSPGGRVISHLISDFTTPGVEGAAGLTGLLLWVWDTRTPAGRLLWWDCHSITTEGNAKVQELLPSRPQHRIVGVQLRGRHVLLTLLVLANAPAQTSTHQSSSVASHPGTASCKAQSTSSNRRQQHSAADTAACQLRFEVYSIQPASASQPVRPTMLLEAEGWLHVPAPCLHIHSCQWLSIPDEHPPDESATSHVDQNTSYVGTGHGDQHIEQPQSGQVGAVTHGSNAAGLSTANAAGPVAVGEVTHYVECVVSSLVLPQQVAVVELTACTFEHVSSSAAIPPSHAEDAQRGHAEDALTESQLQQRDATVQQTSGTQTATAWHVEQGAIAADSIQRQGQQQGITHMQCTAQSTDGTCITASLAFEGPRPSLAAADEGSVADVGQPMAASICSNTASRPVLLYVYGAYGQADDVEYQTAREVLVKRGWCIAVAHVRGGGGPHAVSGPSAGVGDCTWHLAGNGCNKQRGVEDLLAVAHMLLLQGWGVHGRLHLATTSAGAWLGAAAMNRAPHLFCAAVLTVPSLDILTSILDDQDSIHELGDAVSDPVAYAAIHAWSPVDNLPDGRTLADGYIARQQENLEQQQRVQALQQQQQQQHGKVQAQQETQKQQQAMPTQTRLLQPQQQAKQVQMVGQTPHAGWHQVQSLQGGGSSLVSMQEYHTSLKGLDVKAMAATSRVCLFPHVLVRVGLQDTVCDFWESVKYVAKLRQSLHDAHTVLQTSCSHGIQAQQHVGLGQEVEQEWLRNPAVVLQLKTGDHGAFQTIEDDASMLAFLQWTVDATRSCSTP